MSDSKDRLRRCRRSVGVFAVEIGSSPITLGGEVSVYDTLQRCLGHVRDLKDTATARERKAAAKALREAADSAVQDAEWKGVTEKTYTSHQMAQWLRTLADLAEKGER